MTPEMTASDWLMKRSKMWIPDEGQSKRLSTHCASCGLNVSHSAALWRIRMRGRYGSCHHLREQVGEEKFFPPTLTTIKDTTRSPTHTHMHTQIHTHTHTLSNSSVGEKGNRKQLFWLWAFICDLTPDNMELLRVATVWARLETGSFSLPVQ